MINIRLLNDINNVHKFLSVLSKQGYRGVATRSINKTIMSVRSKTNDIAREKRKLKKGELNRDFFRVNKARVGRKTDTPKADLSVRNRPIGLLRFVVGAKSPREQKGIPVKRRKKLSVEVVPGQKVRLPKSFIQKGQNGLFNVFRRQGPEKTPLYRHATTSLFKVLDTPTIKDRLFKFAVQRMEIEFERAANMHIESLIAKTKGPLG